MSDPDSHLKDLLHEKSRSQRDKLLLLLAAKGGKAKSITEVREIAVANGLRSAKTWKPSSILGGDRTQVILSPAGWELTGAGKARVAAILGPASDKPTVKAATDLRAHLSKLKNPDAQAFVLEAVQCLEANYLRAAVVLTWVGAVSVLYDHVVSSKLTAFNSEALKRDPKWRSASNADDLARMKEHDFLNVIESISVIGKSVKAELHNALTLRNGCGHPNSLRLGHSRVAAHVEVLILNVFQKF